MEDETTTTLRMRETHVRKEEEDHGEPLSFLNLYVFNFE